MSALTFALLPVLWASGRSVTLPTPINAPVVSNLISSFQTQPGQNLVSWTETGVASDGTSSGTIASFQDGNGGTATIHWSSPCVLALWTITSTTGGTQTYVDGASQGQPGSFILPSGVVGMNNVVLINRQGYTMNGTVLEPNQGTANATGLSGFVYGGTSYQAVSAGYDYQGRDWIILAVSDGSNPTPCACSTSFSQGMQINFSDGTSAYYTIDATGRSYVYSTTSSAPNSLTQINGYPLTTANNLSLLPAPIQSFVCNGSVFALTSCTWNSAYYSSNPQQNACLAWNYTSSNGNAVGEFFPSGQISEFDVIIGTSTFGLGSGSVLGTYQALQGSGAAFTTFNGQPYAWTGSLLVPQGPVGGFTYGGSAYQISGAVQSSNGDWITQYQTAGPNPQTATVEYSPVTGAIVKMSINSASGGTATYVDGSTVGQPGAYVWSSTSTAANLLSSVNNNTYNPNGSSDLPSTAQTTNGVFDVQGNFMNLGSWTTDSTHAGFSLSYYDGQTSMYPANIEFTASRPSTSWSWDAATADGTGINAVMQVDETSRLLLYPPVDPAATPSGVAPTPSVILDPSPTGISRFDGAVRISPQGDLSMGAFTSESTPTPAQ